MEYTLLRRFIGYPVHDVIEERLTGAVHTAEVGMIAGLDRFKAPKQKLLFFSLLRSLSFCSLSFCLLFQPISLHLFLFQPFLFQPFSFHSLSFCSL